MKRNGALTFATDEGYPEYRDFPVFPNEAVTVGSVWAANGIWVVDPKNDGKLTDLPILVEYRLQGEGSVNGEETWKLDAKFATRYPGSVKSARADSGLKSAIGTHDCQIIVRKSDGAVLVIIVITSYSIHYTKLYDGQSGALTHHFRYCHIASIRNQFVKII